MGVWGSKRALACLVGVVLSQHSSQAWAEDDLVVLDDETPAETQPADQKTSRVTQLKRIVVGAGVEKVAIDTPQAVSVLDQADIDAKQAATVGELLQSVPGVSASGSQSSLGQTFNIRGVGAPETASDQGRIIVNVDGVGKYYESYRMGGFFSDPDVYKKVEVLRGPASSTLYGAGAIGGVINFVTKDASDFLAPGQTWAVRLKESWSSNGNDLFGSGIYAYRPSEQQEYLLYGSYRKNGNYLSGDGSEVKGVELAAPTALIKGIWHFGDGNEQALKFSFQRWSSDANDQNFVQTSSADGFGTVDRLVTDKTMVLAYENPASDNDWVDFKTQLSYSDTTNAQSDAKDSLGRPWDPVQVPLFQDAVYGYKTWSWQASNTIDYSSSLFDNHLTFGTQLSHQTRSVKAAQQLSYHPGGVDQKAGVFVQDELVWANLLTLIPGVRVDFRQLQPDGSIAGVSASDDYALSPKLAAHYKINDAVGIFASVARTERLPTLDEMYSAWYPGFPDDMTPAYSEHLKKEQALTTEAGFSLTGDDLIASGDTASLKTTFFRNNVKNLIQRLGAGSNFPYINVGRARIEGVEIELAYDVDWAYANASYAHTRGYDLTANTYLDTVAPDALFFTLGGRDRERGVDFGWKTRLVAAQDRVADKDTARPATAGFAVHGIFAGWTPQEGMFKGMTAQFAIDNLFNRQYRDYLSNEDGYGRTFKISLTQAFGG